MDPVVCELIEGELSVKVFCHDLPVGNGSIPCWTYVTAGLSKMSQPELVMTVERDPNEAPKQFPEDPLNMF